MKYNPIDLLGPLIDTDPGHGPVSLVLGTRFHTLSYKGFHLYICLSVCLRGGPQDYRSDLAPGQD